MYVTFKNWGIVGSEWIFFFLKKIDFRKFQANLKLSRVAQEGLKVTTILLLQASWGQELEVLFLLCSGYLHVMMPKNASIYVYIIWQ